MANTVDVQTADDLSALVAMLAEDLVINPDGWENDTLERFLSAMAAWIQSMDSYARNTGDVDVMAPSWNTFAKILLASRVYE
jgi:hypothetical protein